VYLQCTQLLPSVFSFSLSVAQAQAQTEAQRVTITKIEVFEDNSITLTNTEGRHITFTWNATSEEGEEGDLVFENGNIYFNNGTILIG
jgi:hypothetical protein